MAMKKGDKFYYPSKYGGGVFGEVEEVFYTNILHPTFNELQECFRSTNKVNYRSKDVLLVSKILSSDQIEIRKKFLEGIKNSPKLKNI